MGGHNKLKWRVINLCNLKNIKFKEHVKNVECWDQIFASQN